jgi:DNA primase
VIHRVDPASAGPGPEWGQVVGGSPQGDFVHAVRSALDLARLVSDYVPLKNSGRKLKGLCPFHGEKTPSFMVDPEKNLYYCFGCQTGGDAFDFFMRMEKLDFGDALLQLAARFGVPIPSRERREGGETSRLIEMHREAASFYRRMLATSAAARARDYLDSRGLSPRTREELGIGYAPASWDALTKHLATAGYREEEMVKGGLAARRKEGRGCYDWFRDRIVFPIERVGGGIIGFGGRTLGEGEPKYLNSPETPIFSKGRNLYGLVQARPSIRDQGAALLVEGYVDFASLWESGIRHAAAVLGTGFTPEHGRLLGRFTRNVILAFDPDRAGRQAADRALGILLEQEFDVRVLELPEGEDPDAFVRRRGAEACRERISGAPGAVDHLIAVACQGRALDRPEDKARIASELLPRLALISNRVLRAAALARAAERLGVPEEALAAELSRLRRPDASAASPAPAPAGRSTVTGRPAERRLLQVLLLDASAPARLAEVARDEDFAGLAHERLFRTVLAQQRAGLEISVNALRAIVPPEDGEALLAATLDDHPEVRPGEWEDCWRAMVREALEKESREVQRRLAREIEEGGQAEGLLRRKLEIRQRIDALS